MSEKLSNTSQEPTIRDNQSDLYDDAELNRCNEEVRRRIENLEPQHLHGQTQPIRIDQPLLSLEEARVAYAINASVVGVFELPQQRHTGEYKQFAILDFGAYSQEQNGTKIPTYMNGVGKTYPRLFGDAKSRFGLKALNHTPESHMDSYVPIEGESIVVGRSEASAQRLGIKDDEMVSRQHLKIEIDTESGLIDVTDQSTNGTLLLARPVKMIHPE